MTEITPQATFEDRMMNRIRDSIGDLMTDEELAEVVKKGVQKAFFEERKREYGYNMITEEAWLVVELRKLLREEIKLVVQKEMASRSDELAKVVAEVVQQDAGKAILAAVSDTFRKPMNELEYAVTNRLQGLT